MSRANQLNFIHLGVGRLADRAAAEAACQIDAAADRDWLAAHPAQAMVVGHGPLGSQIRLFVTPEN